MPLVCVVEGHEEAAEALLVLAYALLADAEVVEGVVEQGLVVGGLVLALLDGLAEELLGLFVHLALEVDHGDVVEQAGDILLGAVVVALDGLVVVLEGQLVGLLDCVAGAQVVHPLRSLLQGLLLGVLQVVLGGLGEVFQPEVTVAQIKRNSIILMAPPLALVGQLALHRYSKLATKFLLLNRQYFYDSLEVARLVHLRRLLDNSQFLDVHGEGGPHPLEHLLLLLLLLEGVERLVGFLLQVLFGLGTIFTSFGFKCDEQVNVVHFPARDDPLELFD